jgi:tetratricopeptide (TPR) repeat protein
MTKPTTPPPAWEDRIAELWSTIGDYAPEDFVDAMISVVGQLSANSPEGLFELGSAYDSTGQSDQAVPLYQKALDHGLQPPRRRRAVIQMASSMRNLGQSNESVVLLREELARGSDELDDALHAFLALSLSEMGNEREGLSLVLKALAAHLPRYHISVANYAELLLDDRND